MILQALAVVSMIGVLFTMPQYFQAVLGTNAMGSGPRLLPLIAGLVVGAVPADRAARSVGGRLTTAAGFGLLAAGLALGSQTGVGSSDGFIATWMAIVVRAWASRWPPPRPPPWPSCRRSEVASARR